ncbi:MAG: ABC transporter substrate-binding protein [Acidiferrobacteraceae bacterium]|nr:ABC transporter substrate-binding protein [Acidiferrobacteraceae bacterium]
MLDDVLMQLAPTGVLRAGINVANTLLVTGRHISGQPVGIAPDIAASVAEYLGISIAYVEFASPGDLIDAASSNTWDIGLIGIDLCRAQVVDFTAPYIEIDATYLVRSDSYIQSIGEVDRPGMQIAVSNRSAYDLYLTRHLSHASLYRADGLDAAVKLFTSNQLDALAGLRPRLLSDKNVLRNTRLLSEKFTSVEQAIAIGKGKSDAFKYLCQHVELIKSSKIVRQLMARHGVVGLSVPT